ncbi:MAG: MotA/TolQ/ExbB proton channel family protein [Candidatus Sumerlaeaceae bacterium]|jgi:biopolymer transport protein TolQ
MIQFPITLGGIAFNHVNVFQAISDSDFMGIICLMACLLLSIMSWTIILYKFVSLSAASRQSEAFMKKCLTTGSLDQAFKLAKRYPESPLAQIFRDAYLEMQLENWYADSRLGPEQLLLAARTSLERVLERTINEEIRRLESYLIFLATTSNVAPFIGLFGTVWGVLGAFQALSRSGSAALSALAPGMATALTATIAGLFAAIPASVFYNYFTNKIAILISQMDSFALQLANVIMKQIISSVSPEVR